MFERKVVSCDIQPRYAGGVPFKLHELIAYLNNFDRVLYLYNDKNIGVPDTEEDIKKMLQSDDPLNLTPELFKKIKFRPKVYFYFRDILDEPTCSYEECVKLLKMLILRGVDNAYDLCRHDLEICLSNNNLISDIEHGIKHFYYDPSLATDLLQFDNCINIGGFENQCNVEINLYMDAMGISYQKNYKFIF